MWCVLFWTLCLYLPFFSLFQHKPWRNECHLAFYIWRYFGLPRQSWCWVYVNFYSLFLIAVFACSVFSQFKVKRKILHVVLRQRCQIWSLHLKTLEEIPKIKLLKEPCLFVSYWKRCASHFWNVTWGQWKTGECFIPK